jgi:hypothetical protein
MIAFRCSLCTISWPNESVYRRCPQCEGRTDQISDAAEDEVLPVEEAASLARHYEFERLYPEDSAPPKTEVGRHMESYFDGLDSRLKRASFDSVIKGAGYTAEEKAEIERLEKGLRRYDPD